MKTITLIKGTLLCFLVMTITTGYSQDIGGIIKRKVKKRTTKEINKTVDKTMDVVVNPDGTTTSEEKTEDGTVVVVTKDESGNYIPVANFIDPGTALFVDDFNTEVPSEFPSKWTLLKGTLQNSQVVALGQKEGVIEFRTSSRLKPTFKNDNYLGDSFKIEIQCYFHKKGNEAYTLNLQNKDNLYLNYGITIRSDGIVPGGSSHEYARFPQKLPAGWRTVQLSFNNGVLKVFYEGYQLINIPRLHKGEDKIITEFTHLELSALSRNTSKAMVNHIAIAHNGLPLYKKLMAEGKLVMNNINFEVNSYTLKADSYSVLDGIASMMREHPEIALHVHGHTDSDGTNSANQTLSENRAKAVSTYLISKGIASSRLSSKGHGESQPLDTNNSEMAKAKNRRVEFILKK